MRKVFLIRLSIQLIHINQVNLDEENITVMINALLSLSRFTQPGGKRTRYVTTGRLTEPYMNKNTFDSLRPNHK